MAIKKKDALHKELTKEDVEKYFTDIFKEWEERSKKEKKIVMYQGCLEQGIVTRDFTGFYLNMCNNPKCGSCRMIDKIFKEEAKKFTQ